MVLGKLKGLAVAVVLLLLGVGMLTVSAEDGAWLSTLPALLARMVTLAPVPPNPAGENQIWVLHRETGKLVALDLNGQPQGELALKDGYLLRGISPPLNQLWFAGRNGRLPLPPPDNPGFEGGFTLHVREINDQIKGTDLGIDITGGTFVSRDGKTVGSVVTKQNGRVDRPFIFENALIDVATKRVIRLDLPGNHQLIDIAPDGTWVLSFEYVFPRAEPGTSPCRLHHLPVVGGKPRLLSGTLCTWYGHRISPDGTRVLTFAVDPADRDKRNWLVSAYLIDVATAKTTRISGQEKQLWSGGVWSPDGKRIAYAWRARADDGQPILSDGVPPTRLVVCDADGTNAKTILTTEEQIVPLAWW